MRSINRLATTVLLAAFLPEVSEIISVIKKVIGYGRIPTDNSKIQSPMEF
jgi:hypothetical protein